MKNSHFCILILGLMVFVLLSTSLKVQKKHLYNLIYPENWPQPNYDFSKKPLTNEGIALGRRLFYDPILSRDTTVSCANCHLSFTAFTHVDHALSHGIDDRIGTRNSMTLTNLAWSKAFMWDGSVQHLDFQALAPISHPSEMDNSIDKVVQKLNKNPNYKRLFSLVFADSVATGERVLKALSQFELTLISANSKYDRMILGKENYTEQEQNGYHLFKKNCATCHAEPFFTNLGFEKNGLAVDTSLNDFGRMMVSKNPLDSLKFKVPTLRNIEFSQPYMHDGRFKKLRQVIDYYSKTTTLDRKIELSAHEKVDLMAFLMTLTDREFLFNPEFSFPKK
jgi:cytochrome c peroxidase